MASIEEPNCEEDVALLVEFNDKDNNEKSVNSIENEDFYTRYGWGRVRPDCLQFLLRPGWMVTVMSLLMLVTSIQPTVYMTQTFERRFHFTSTEMGTICIPASVICVFAMLIISHYSEHGNKVKWVVWTASLEIVGHFMPLLSRYASPRTDVGSTNLGAAGNISNTNYFCSATNQIDRHNECFIGQEAKHFSNVAWYINAFGCICGSISLISHGTTMLSYLHENVDRGSSIFFSGIVLASQALSTGIAAVVASLALTLHEDFDRIDTSKLNVKLGDANWVGAYWLPNTCLAVAVFISIIPYSGFPKRFPKSKIRDSTKTRSVELTKERTVTDRSKIGERRLHAKDEEDILKKLPSAVMTVLKTPIFICGTIRQMTDALLMAGFGMFLPKFLEVQYGFSTEVAVILPGAIGLLPVIIGTLTVGAIVSRLQLETRGIYVMSFFAMLLSLTFAIPFLMPCPTPKYAGVNAPYDIDTHLGISAPHVSQSNLSHACNTECHCSKSIFDPYCSSAGITYYSPCYAGCMSPSNCTCLQLHSSASDHQSFGNLIRGTCSSACPWKPALFCVCLAFGIMFGASCGFLIVQSNLVGVPFHVRTLALGMQMVASDLFGALPGGAITGRLFDKNCILWKEICSNKAECLLYNTYGLAFSLSALAGAIRVIQLIALYLGARFSPSSEMPTKEKRRVVKLFSKFERWFFGVLKSQLDEENHMQ